MSKSEKGKRYLYYLKKYREWADILSRLSRNIEKDDTGRWSKDFREKWQGAMVKTRWYFHLSEVCRFGGELHPADRAELKKYYSGRVKAEMQNPEYEKLPDYDQGVK